MNNPLLSPSLAQQEYLADQLRRRSMIRIWRILLLILILSLWELSASLGLIDRFIFSSPSLILKCLISMTADRTIFLHTGVTLMETLISLLSVPQPVWSVPFFSGPVPLLPAF